MIRSLLSPYFAGEPELGIELPGFSFDVVVSASLADGEPNPIEAVALINEAISHFVSSALRSNTIPFVVAGDCLSALGCLGGLNQEGVHPNLLWIDAHGDFNTPETTPTGHLGGMPLAAIFGLGLQHLREAMGFEPLSRERIWLAGARDLDDDERIALDLSGIVRKNLLGQLIGLLPKDEPLWVHIDSDYIDPKYAPAMRYRSNGGPRPAGLARELAEVVQRCRVVGASLSAWAPHLDIEGKTAAACTTAIAPVLKM